MAAMRFSGISASYALALVDIVEKRGVTESDLLAPLALSREELLRPGAQLDADTFQRLVERATTLAGEPGLALYLGLRMRVAMHGFVGFAAMSASSMREGLEILDRFSRILIPVSWWFTVDGDESSMELTVDPSFAATEEFIVSATFVGLATMARELVPQSLDGRAELTFARPTWFERLKHLVPIGATRFGCVKDRLVFPTDVLERPLVSSDPLGVQLAIAQCERELHTRDDRGTWGVRVIEAARDRDGRFRKLEEVARVLGVSPRSLKRHLAAAGTTFSELAENAKRDRAVFLLERGDKVESIGRELGYETGAFLRAFRRWTGLTPGEYRKRNSP